MCTIEKITILTKEIRKMTNKIDKGNGCLSCLVFCLLIENPCLGEGHAGYIPLFETLTPTSSEGNHS